MGLVIQLVRMHRAEQPCLGVRKLYHMLKPELKKAGVKLGRDRLFCELKRAGLLVAKRRAEWPKTTQINRNLPVFRNLVKGLKVRRRNQVWVADITYIRTKEGFVYLALVTDRWSRKIVGFALSKSLATGICLRALDMAVRSLRRGERPIHHSDRGCQYASHAYVQQTQQAGLTMSMTEKDHSAENSVAERVNGILKQEYWLDMEFEDYRHAHRGSANSIMLYNTKRPHLALRMKTPQQVHGF